MSQLKTQVKICCISSLEEAKLAKVAGAYALGLVSAMPSGPGVIEEGLIAHIIQEIGTDIETFLLTSLTRTEDIIAQAQRLRPSTIQLVDALSAGTHADIKAALPHTKLVQVIHVLDEASVVAAKAAAQDVDHLLLDSGNPNLAVKELGGTGRVHDWRLSRQIVAEAGVPVFLAGGLRAHNAGQAIWEVGPFGLDICSGVRTAGQLDPEKLEAFFQAVWKADQAIA
ncbi:MAG: phosphoribosylanthranilate isomerase [Bacteroidota bacterium]